jgi:archaemetzincin
MRVAARVPSPRARRERAPRAVGFNGREPSFTPVNAVRQRQVCEALARRSAERHPPLVFPPRRRSACARRDVLGGLGAFLIGGPTETAFAQGPPTRGRVVIVPLGAVSALEITVVQRALLAFYALDVSAVAPHALARSAYYPKRGRYRAERLLTQLEHDADASALRVLGLASVDISTTKGKVEDWGILGLASLDGRVGVLSSFRCRRGARSAEQVAHRLGKTAVHELGHTFGLEHCSGVACLMRDGRGSVFTTDGDYDLCANCREKLGSRELLVVPPGEPPWPRPA